MMRLIGAVNPQTGCPEILDEERAMSIVARADWDGLAHHMEDGQLYIVAGDYWRGTLPVGRLLRVDVVHA